MSWRCPAAGAYPPRLGDHTLAELAARPGIVQSWVAGLRLVPSTARAVVGILSAILSAAVDDGLIPRNPCQAKSVKRPKIPARKVVPWTAEQVRAVREALGEVRRDFGGRYQVITDLGTGLGLRQGEMFGISPDDVTDWMRPGKAVLHVRRQVKYVGGKLIFAPAQGGQGARHPLAEPVRLALAAHLAAYPPAEVTLPWGEPGGKPVTVRLMVTTTAGQAVNKNWFNRTVWKPALRVAGVPAEREDGTPARRTGATRCGTTSRPRCCTTAATSRPCRSTWATTRQRSR